jgi:cell division protein FtsA
MAWVRGALGSARILRPNLEDSIAAEECVKPLLEAGRRAMRRVGRLTGVGEWELLDATLVTFSVGGHRVTDPVGFRGHVLEATAFVTAAPSRLLNALRRIADGLQLEPPSLVAEPLALAAASPSDGLTIQVGARTTGLVLSRYGAPVSFAGTCQGGMTLVEALADALGISAARADVMLRAYALGKLGDSDSSLVGDALEEPLLRWLSAVIECLRSWTAIPGEWAPFVYLCGGVSALGDLERLVTATQWLEVLPFPFTPQVKIWDGSNVEHVLDQTDQRWQAESVTTLSLAAWALRDRGPSTLDGVLRASLDIQ